MGANAQFIATPLSGGANLTAANTRSDGVGTLGTDIFLVAGLDQAGTLYPLGGFIQRVSLMVGIGAPGSTVACVIRLFESTQLTNAVACTAANTKFIREIAVPVTAVGPSVGSPPIDIPLQKMLAKGTGILATTSVAQTAGTFWSVVPWNFGAY